MVVGILEIRKDVKIIFKICVNASISGSRKFDDFRDLFIIFNKYEIVCNDKYSSVCHWWGKHDD